MKLTIVYDNEVYKKGLGLQSDWGFSCLITTDDDMILLDTGANGHILLNNMKKLGIVPDEIRAIVISHEHHDHNGGLADIAPFVGKTQLFRLWADSPSREFTVIPVKRPLEICDGVYSTGKLHGTIDEQALVLQGENGYTVLVGCSHPGVGRILKAAEHYGHVNGLVGGLHGFNNFSLLEELDFVCPCHCTTEKTTIRKLFPETSIECGVGRILEI